ncbi:MAG: hypothetical protein SPK05_03395 [Eubacteriales bacterium]|nr:hypothetical protein [Eubacteriales bacterium]
MKRMKMGIAVLITAALLLVCMTPLAVFADNTRYPTPGGYNDNDYQKLVTFLELEDESGVRNGEKISENYDPQDPTTWEGTTWENGNIFQIDFYDRNLIGKLDVSNCTELVDLVCSYNQLTELDISNNTAMWFLDCGYNQLTELDVSNNTALVHLYCGDNQLTELDISNNTAMWYLYCGNNQLTELDVSNNTALMELGCSDNQLTELDISNNTALGYLACDDNLLTELDISNNTAMWELSCRNNQLTSLNLESSYSLSFLADRVEAEGNGFIAVNLYSVVEDDTYFGCVYAEPKSGSTFIGWYDENGVLLSSEAEFDISDANSTVFIAKFEGGSPELTEYTVTINHNENGATDPTAGSYTVADGEEIAITITPDEKYMVQSVLVNGVETVTEIVENVLTLTITGDTTVEVVFTKIPKTGAIALTSMAIMSMISGAAIIIYKKK